MNRRATTDRQPRGEGIMSSAGMLGRGIALSAVLCLAACAEYRISVPDSDPIQLEGQDAPYVERSMNAYLWGNILDPQARVRAGFLPPHDAERIVEEIVEMEPAFADETTR